VVAPTEVKRTVAPKRQKNAELWTVSSLHSRRGRGVDRGGQGQPMGHRDTTIILLTYRHGLRAAEVSIRSRATNYGDCAGSQRESPSSPFVFVSERGSPFTTAGFARMIERTADGAGLEINAHPHMLRHACGYALANKGHDTRAIQGWLGHHERRGATDRHQHRPAAGVPREGRVRLTRVVCSGSGIIGADAGPN
jgi:hypothetical protein